MSQEQARVRFLDGDCCWCKLLTYMYAKWESFFHLLYPSQSSAWTQSMAPLNALHNSLLADLKPPLASYITLTDKAHHHASFGDDYSAPCQWYVRGIANLGVDEEKKALAEGKIGGKLRVPTLMIGGLRDEVCPASWARKSMEGFVVGGTKGGLLKVVDVDAGHVSLPCLLNDR